MKKGYRTSEFWVGVVGSIVTLLNGSGIMGSFTLPSEAILSMAGIVATYILSRTIVKANTK